jgi:predicted  nucleic acid-binding Zn-ribbon protein
MATPETLLPAERALAFLELQKVDSQLTLASENRRLQSAMSREDRDKLAALNKRLQTETDENARLRKDLEEAQKKLDAVANIERSLNDRKP